MAATMARGSHHPALVNSPQVAAVSRTMVTSDRTWVMDQATPLVGTPWLANEGVSHRKVVPNRNRAAPPRLRMVNIADHLRPESGAPAALHLGSSGPRPAGLSRARVPVRVP